eukprot:scaffold88984_cov39-Prasinocladus_malaysianus.AAC.2
MQELCCAHHLGSMPFLSLNDKDLSPHGAMTADMVRTALLYAYKPVCIFGKNGLTEAERHLSVSKHLYSVDWGSDEPDWRGGLSGRP